VIDLRIKNPTRRAYHTEYLLAHATSNKVKLLCGTDADGWPPSQVVPIWDINVVSSGGRRRREGLWKQQIAYSRLTIWNRSHHLQQMQQRLGRAPKGYCETYVDGVKLLFRAASNNCGTSSTGGSGDVEHIARLGSEP